MLLKITGMTCPVKAQQFILLFSATSFGLKGHDQVEHKIKILYTHSGVNGNVYFPLAATVLSYTITSKENDYHCTVLM